MNSAIAATLFNANQRLPIDHESIEGAIKANGHSSKFFIVKKKEQAPCAVKLSCEGDMLVEDGIKVLYLSDVEFIARA
jgi:hypothetical protein